MFKMVAANRVATFYRGANELLAEWQQYKHLEGLDYDESIVLYYPLPRFLFTAKENQAATKRLEIGLIRAYHAGQVQQLWQRYHRDSLSFVKLHKRKIFRLKNPYLEGLNLNFERFVYIPGS